MENKIHKATDNPRGKSITIEQIREWYFHLPIDYEGFRPHHVKEMHRMCECLLLFVDAKPVESRMKQFHEAN